ncbi:MAG: NUDIX hydrolase [Parcubacteria group bacterium]|nr:NUDIX hydrolase [Parcubacteria group bacterium]
MTEWTARDEKFLAGYLAFMAEHRAKVEPLGNAGQGEIEILTDPEQAKAAVLAMRGRLAKRPGMTEETLFDWTRLGEVYRDQYARIVRFPVKFPGGTLGTYITWYWDALFGQVSAACGMPLMPDGKVALIRVYRHATRTWTLEFPRGGTEPGRSIFDALRKEVKEEAGFDVGEAFYLGDLEPDNGILSSSVPVYLVRIIGEGATAHEYAEAIGGKIFFTPAELEAILAAEHYVEKLPDGTSRTYHVRGAFEHFAFSQAKVRGLLNFAGFDLLRRKV